MALPSTLSLEVRPDGDDNNGGGFNPSRSGAVSDYTYPTQTVFTYSDLAIDATLNTKITSATRPFTANDVGNLINITAGAGFTTGRYEVISVASGAATLDRVVGTAGATGGSGKLGGALATLTRAQQVAIASNTIWVRNGTYPLTAGILFSVVVTINGYDTVRTTAELASNKPVLQAAANSITLLNINVNRSTVRNIAADCASRTAVNAFNFNGLGFRSEYLRVDSCIGTGITITGQNARARNCLVNMGASGTGIASGSNLLGCEVVIPAGSAAVGISNSQSGFTMERCLVRGGSGGSSVGYTIGNASGSTRNCAAYGLGSDGFRCTISDTLDIEDCVSYGNGGWGFTFASINGQGEVWLRNCAHGGNTSGNVSGAIFQEGNVALTADPFLDAPGGNLGLNNVAGGGAACRGVGVLPLSPSGLSVNSRDLGAYQHEYLTVAQSAEAVWSDAYSPNRQLTA